MAVATCARCGTFLCGDCTELLGDAALCPDCLALVRREGTPSWSLTGALGLQCIALVAAPLLLLLPFEARVEPGHGTIVLPLLRRLPVLQLLAFGVGWPVGARELQRLVHGALPSWARVLARLTRGLAAANLGFVLVQGLLVARLVLGLFGR
ncbi:hypothetical protein [Archangium primigenium]|uniref:hypothetical protein n=1 Tax=[Archangium] primigenium TaxID=2792470 RepID=UPI001959E6DF|nr:hypothetical protein [Archangium primigenium]MBM7111915.1 hypothetical protein [Archangium primigenium]